MDVEVTLDIGHFPLLAIIFIHLTRGQSLTRYTYTYMYPLLPFITGNASRSGGAVG